MLVWIVIIKISNELIDFHLIVGENLVLSIQAYILGQSMEVVLRH